MDFTTFVFRLEELGVQDVLLPFILIFVLVFAIMQNTKVLSEKKAINSIVAIVMGLSVVIPHVLGIYSTNSDPVFFINMFLPYIAIIIVAVITFLLVLGAVGINILDDSTKAYPYVVLFALTFNFFTKQLYPGLAPSVLILTLIIAVYLIFTSKGPETKGAAQAWISLFAALVVIGIFFYIKGWTYSPRFLNFMTTYTFQNTITILGIILILILFLIKSDDED